MTKLFGKYSFVFPQRHPKMQQIISFDAFSLTMPSQFLVDWQKLAKVFEPFWKTTCMFLFHKHAEKTQSERQMTMSLWQRKLSVECHQQQWTCQWRVDHSSFARALWTQRKSRKDAAASSLSQAHEKSLKMLFLRHWKNTCCLKQKHLQMWSPMVTEEHAQCDQRWEKQKIPTNSSAHMWSAQPLWHAPTVMSQGTMPKHHLVLCTTDHFSQSDFDVSAARFLVMLLPHFSVHCSWSWETCWFQLDWFLVWVSISRTLCSNVLLQRGGDNLGWVQSRTTVSQHCFFFGWWENWWVARSSSKNKTLDQRTQQNAAAAVITHRIELCQQCCEHLMIWLLLIVWQTHCRSWAAFAGYKSENKFHFDTQRTVEVPEALSKETPISQWVHKVHKCAHSCSIATGKAQTAMQVSRFFINLNETFSGCHSHACTQLWSICSPCVCSVATLSNGQVHTLHRCNAIDHWTRKQSKEGFSRHA